MTMPNGPSGVDNNYYGVTNDGTVPGMTTRTQSNTEASLKTKVGGSPGWNGASNTFFGTLFGGFLSGLTGFISGLFGGLTGTSGGSFTDLLGWLTGVNNKADGAKADAQSAITAAQAADRKVTALINGGTRTIYTSNFTYTKPNNLVKLAVIIFNGGGAGGYGGYGVPGGIGGGYVYQEFPASAVPASVTGTVAAGRVSASGVGQGNVPSSFGSLLSGAVTNKGAVTSASGALDATPSAPGSGGISGIDNNTPNGTDGGSSILAAGGAGGNASTIVGGNGANAATDQQYLAGGGGGGGGRALSQIGAASGRGGAGGFPGGGGGGGGRDSFSQYPGGTGAPGLIALIEYLS